MCEEWKTCTNEESRLNRATNECVIKPEIRCQLDGRFWSHDTSECVDLTICETRLVRDDETNTCVKLFCPKLDVDDGCVPFSVCDS